MELVLCLVGALVLIGWLLGDSGRPQRHPSDDLLDPSSPYHTMRTFQALDGLDGEFDGEIHPDAWF